MIDPFATLLQARDPDFSVEGLIKLVVLFMFFVLPVITSILKKLREATTRPPQPGERGPQPMSQEELQKNLERKLREMLGEPRSEQPELVQMPAPPPPPRAPAPRPPRANRPSKAPKKPQKHVEDYAESLGSRAESFARGGTGGKLATASAMQMQSFRGGARPVSRGVDALALLRSSTRAKQSAILLAEILGPPKALAEPEREF